MPTLKTYDLFISHCWDYNDDYYRVVEMLNAASNFQWRNYSVPEHDPLAGGPALAAQLDRQIRPVNAVLILAGMYVSRRDWIQNEIEMASAYGKPMIGIMPRGNVQVPAAVTAACKEVVGWNTDSIVWAIRTHAL